MRLMCSGLRRAVDADDSAGHVQIHDRLERLRLIVRQRFTRGDARVVDKDIHPAEPRPDAKSVRSGARPITSQPGSSDLSAATARSAVSCRLPKSATRAPFCKKTRTTASPIPRVPPGAIAVFPCSSSISVPPETRIFMPLGYHILMKKHQSGYRPARSERQERLYPQLHRQPPRRLRPDGSAGRRAAVPRRQYR